ncbi:MAG: CPBP family intramembrane metalloprotease [Desulfurivibrio sp.]|nr:MAG: CPBP family intramembrane metalloprotease [Desulfurivibrio sp.]
MSHTLRLAFLEPEASPAPVSRHPLLVIIWSFGLFILIHTTQYVYMGLASAATGATFDEIASGKLQTSETLLLRGLVGLLVGIPATLLVTRFLWRRRPEWMGSRLSIGLFLRGLALGLAAVILIVVILAVVGVARLSLPAYETGLKELLAIQFGLAGWALFTGVAEEYVFRGMAARELAVRWGWPVATITGGIYFSAAHLMALLPLLTLGAMLGILMAGIVAHTLFTALYLRSGSLWLPIGFHAAWNFALSGLFGVTLSGRSGSSGLLHVDLTGPSLLTGGNFGIESSAVAVMLMAVMIPGVLRWRRRRSMAESHRITHFGRGSDPSQGDKHA